MPATGVYLLKLAAQHVGEKYILGAHAPKNNPQWKGPWDCAEFASWLVFQACGALYGCLNNSGDPAVADAYTGYWARDANSLGKIISVNDAATTPGAAVLRVAQPGAVGHIVISDGAAGTVEAHSTKRGVIRHSLSGRRWDMGILVPGIQYKPGSRVVEVAPARTVVLRLTSPPMQDPTVRELQRALRSAGFDPGPVDGEFGPLTHAAVVALQVSRGLTPDGEVGPRTAKVLGIHLPPS